MIKHCVAQGTQQGLLMSETGRRSQQTQTCCLPLLVRPLSPCRLTTTLSTKSLKGLAVEVVVVGEVEVEVA